MFNYLFAASRGGAFIIRIEDTDARRSKPEYEDDLFETLRWLDMRPSEYKDVGPHAPYVQSLRSELYALYAQKLLETGHAYRCYTSSKSEAITEDNPDAPYDRSSRNLTAEESARYEKEFAARGEKPVLRLKLPLEGGVTFHDMLLGDISRDYKDVIADPILIKSDGLPTYHFANVVDDHLMEITHVIRSQEWIPTTPVHVYLYRAFGWSPPQFCHLPMVLGEDGRKLSKRNGSVSAREVRAEGILPEALINCVALLGWSFDDKTEFFTKGELEKIFKDGALQKSPAQFSMQKLRWFNAHYLRALDDARLAQDMAPYIQEAGFAASLEDAAAVAAKYMEFIKPRAETLRDAARIVQPLFVEPDVSANNFFEDDDAPDADGKNGGKPAASPETALWALTTAQGIFTEYFSGDSASGGGDAAAVEAQVKKAAKERGVPLHDVYMPLRISLTGSKNSPPIVRFALCMRKEQVLGRLAKAIALLEPATKSAH